MSEHTKNRVLHASPRARGSAAVAVALALLAVTGRRLAVAVQRRSRPPTRRRAPSRSRSRRRTPTLKAALAARTDEVDDLTARRQKAAAERAAGAASGQGEGGRREGGRRGRAAQQKAAAERAAAAEAGRRTAAAARSTAAARGQAKADAEKAAAAATGRPRPPQARAAAAEARPPGRSARGRRPRRPSRAAGRRQARPRPRCRELLRARPSASSGCTPPQSPFNWAEFDDVSRPVGVAARRSPATSRAGTGRSGPTRSTRSWQKGMLPLLTWESRPLQGGERPGRRPELLAAQDHRRRSTTTTCTSTREDVVSLGLPMAIRLDHEMNGSWYPWGERQLGRQLAQRQRQGRLREDVAPRARHLRGRGRQRSTSSGSGRRTSSTRCRTGPRTRPGTCASLYPGDDYVDWVGLSGYYRPPFKADQTPTFSYTYDRSLDQLRSITEQADPPRGDRRLGGRAGKSPPGSPTCSTALAKPENADVIGFAWFNHTVTTISGGQRVTNDWRITSRRDSLQAFVDGITNPAAGFVDGPVPVATLAAPRRRAGASAPTSDARPRHRNARHRHPTPDTHPDPDPAPTDPDADPRAHPEPDDHPGAVMKTPRVDDDRRPTRPSVARSTPTAPRRGSRCSAPATSAPPTPWPWPSWAWRWSASTPTRTRSRCSPPARCRSTSPGCPSSSPSSWPPGGCGSPPTWPRRSAGPTCTSSASAPRSPRPATPPTCATSRRRRRPSRGT